MNGITMRALQNQDMHLFGAMSFPWATLEEVVELWNSHLQEHEGGERISTIVEKSGRIIGYGHLIFSSEHPAFRNNQIPEISDLWVLSEERKKGIGTALITQLEEHARKNGYSQIGLGVGLHKDYASAQKLYYRLGYQPNGEGITYRHQPVIPEEKYPVDDHLILWLTKVFSSYGDEQ